MRQVHTLSLVAWWWVLTYGFWLLMCLPGLRIEICKHILQILRLLKLLLAFYLVENASSWHRLLDQINSSSIRLEHRSIVLFSALGNHTVVHRLVFLLLLHFLCMLQVLQIMSTPHNLFAPWRWVSCDAVVGLLIRLARFTACVGEFEKQLSRFLKTGGRHGLRSSICYWLSCFGLPVFTIAFSFCSGSLVSYYGALNRWFVVCILGDHLVIILWKIATETSDLGLARVYAELFMARESSRSLLESIRFDKLWASIRSNWRFAGGRFFSIRDYWT